MDIGPLLRVDEAVRHADILDALVDCHSTRRNLLPMLLVTVLSLKPLPRSKWLRAVVHRLNHIFITAAAFFVI